MAKSLITVGNASAQTKTASATSYFPAFTGLLNNIGTTEAVVARTFRVPGTLSNLYIRIVTNDRAASTVRSRINSADGAQVVTVTGSTTGGFEDITNTDAIIAGDEVNVSFVSGAGGTTLTYTMISLVFAVTTTTVTPMGHLGNLGLTTASVTRYGSFFGYMDAGTNATENTAQVNVPTAGTLANLFVYVSANARTTDTTFRSRVNAADGTMLVTVAGAATGIFEDLSNTDTIAAGDSVCWSFTKGTGSETLTLRMVTVAFVTTNGSSLLLGGRPTGGGTAAAETTYFVTVSGGDSTMPTGLTESDVATEAQFASTYSMLWIYIAANTILASSSYMLRKNGADTAVTVSIPTTTTGEFLDATNSVAVVASDLITASLVIGAGGTTLTLRGRSLLVVDNSGSMLFPAGMDGGMNRRLRGGFDG